MVGFLNPIIQCPVCGLLCLWDETWVISKLWSKNLEMNSVGPPPSQAVFEKSYHPEATESHWCGHWGIQLCARYSLGECSPDSSRALPLPSLLMLSKRQIVWGAKRCYILHWTFISQRKSGRLWSWGRTPSARPWKARLLWPGSCFRVTAISFLVLTVWY